MSWNYRVIRQTGDNGRASVALREVYYDKAGAINGWVESTELGHFDDVDDLIGTLELMLRDARKVKRGDADVIEIAELPRGERR